MFVWHSFAHLLIKCNIKEWEGYKLKQLKCKYVVNISDVYVYVTLNCLSVRNSRFGGC